MRLRPPAALSRLLPLWSWLPIAALLLAGVPTGRPAAAAVPPQTVEIGTAALPSRNGLSTPHIRLAQSSGPLDGLFSIFKPKPKVRRLPDAPASLRKSKPGASRLPGGGGVATLGSDMDPAPIIVRPANRPRTAGGSRSMCVRLCDGYYWPANSGTSTTTIAKDQDTCEQSCQVETKLFIRPSLGADAGDMRDLSGKPYRKLKTAFLYRKVYVPECQCRPDPWSASEQMRHEEYRAAATGLLIGPTTAAPATNDQTAALSDFVDPPDGDATDVELATGDGDESASTQAPAREAQPVLAPQTLSLPATTSRLLPKPPAVKKPKVKSTASLSDPAKSKSPSTPKKRREAIGRTVR
jgi:hypothetical protein